MNKNFVEVIVEDNGIGMDDVTKESLFNLEELVSVEGTAGERGTGFGLVLCKEFVTRNGGTIWAESELNKGSRFIFTVPLAS
jgi:signal transduction histidine kinase